MKKSNGVAYLYLITCTVNGKRYVGVTVEPALRWWTHRWSAGKSQQLIHKSMAKYGPSAFTFEVVASARSWKDGAIVERQLIAQHRTFVDDGGYNLTRGGEGPYGRIVSSETRERIGRSRRGRPGRAIPEAEREIHRLHATNRSPEMKLECGRLATAARIRNGNTGHGRKNSPETIQRMRDAAIRRWRTGAKCKM